jgi:hypothetical protein
MRKSVENQRDFGVLWTDLRWLNSAQIQFALDENHEDSRRMNLQQPPHWEALTAQELTAYHRQLFLWRLVLRHHGRGVAPRRQGLIHPYGG